MKILMVLESNFPPDLRVENEIDALSEAGHEVHLACRELVAGENNNEYPGVTIHRKLMPSLIYKSSVGCLKTSFYFGWWKKYLREILEDNKFDAVHLHDLPLSDVIIDLRRQFGFKFVLDIHENYPILLSLSEHIKRFPANILFDLKQWQDYEKDSIEAADNVIVVVEEAKQRLKQMRVQDTKITVVSNTYPDYKFKEIESKEHAGFTLFYGGGITIHRGLQYVVEAMGKLSKQYPAIVLRIFGKGRYEPELRDLVESTGANVVFEGWTPSENLMIELSKADIALIPHVKSEHTDSTIPHKLFQYMAKGIPVLASNCDPIVRIVETSECGLIYEFDNVNELMKQIEKLYNDKNMMLKMGTNGKDAVKQNYLWKYHAEELKELYKAL